MKRTTLGVAAAALAGLVLTVGGAAEAGKKQKTPPPPFFDVADGEKLIYIVPGAMNDNTGTDTVATVVNCINVGFPDAVQVRVEFWNNPGSVPDASGTQTVSAGESEHWATQSIPYLSEQILSPTLGVNSDASIRVIVLQSGKIICQAYHVLNPESSDTAVQSTTPLRMIPAGKEATFGKGKKK